MLGQPIRILQKCALSVADIDLIRRAVLQGREQCVLVRHTDAGCTQDPTETRSVMVDSVVAPIER